MRASGFGTIEAIVAAALLSLITAGVASTVVLARRIRSDNAREWQANQIAIAAIERMRAGEVSQPSSGTTGFVVAEELRPCNGNARLLEAYVRVTWQDDSHSLELTTLIAR